MAARRKRVTAHLCRHPALHFAGFHRHEQIAHRFALEHHGAHPTFFTASCNAFSPSAMSCVGFLGFSSYSRLMQPWNPTSLSAFTTPGTSSAPWPTITSARFFG